MERAPSELEKLTTSRRRERERPAGRACRSPFTGELPQPRIKVTLAGRTYVPTYAAAYYIAGLMSARHDIRPRVRSFSRGFRPTSQRSQHGSQRLSLFCPDSARFEYSKHALPLNGFKRPRPGALAPIAPRRNDTRLVFHLNAIFGGTKRRSSLAVTAADRYINILI